MSQPKFKFGDTVKITTGFYRDVVGVVRDYRKPFRLTGKSERQYYLEPFSHYGTFPGRSLIEWESNLELVETKSQKS